MSTPGKVTTTMPTAISHTVKTSMTCKSGAETLTRRTITTDNLIRRATGSTPGTVMVTERSRKTHMQSTTLLTHELEEEVMAEFKS